jgi:heterodisulfide reductase subunit B
MRRTWRYSSVKADSTATQFKFFPGCLARLKLPHVERSVRAVLGMLDIEIGDEKRFTCCPDPVVFRSGSREEWLRLAARNLSLDAESPIMTLCPGCASSLSEARHMLLEDQELAAAIGRRLDRLGMSLALPQVYHFLQVLTRQDVMQSLGEKVTERFGNLKAACHYGCHLVRPSSAIDFDDPEKPESLDTLIALTGIQSVQYEDKYMCCGRPSLDEATSVSMAQHKLQRMKDAGCDLIIVACPFCFEQFDLGQVIIGRKLGTSFDMPVLYVTQLLGLAMGIDGGHLGLRLHRVSPKGIYEDV